MKVGLKDGGELPLYCQGDYCSNTALWAAGLSVWAPASAGHSFHLDPEIFFLLVLFSVPNLTCSTVALPSMMTGKSQCIWLPFNSASWNRLRIQGLPHSSMKPFSVLPSSPSSFFSDSPWTHRTSLWQWPHSHHTELRIRDPSATKPGYTTKRGQR